jgi:membrane-associated phospholipid phosphatase
LSSAANLILNPTKNEFLVSIRKWAFPHWTLWATVLIIFMVNAVVSFLNTRIYMEASWFNLNVIFILATIALITLRIFKDGIYDWFLHPLWCVLMNVFLSAILVRNLQLFSHFLMTTPMPLADDFLSSWDNALGFDWLAYSKALSNNQTLKSILSFAYSGLTFGGFAVLPAIIIILNQRLRVIEINFLVLSTSLLCITTAVFFPAKATMALLGDQDLISRFPRGTGVLHVEQLMALRGTEKIYMTSNDVQGLVSFPSLHSCLALIIAWCCRGRWFTSFAGIVICLMILAATPIFGGHYLVDLIGGACVTAFAIWLWRLYFEPYFAREIATNEMRNFPLPNWLSFAQA